MPNETNETIDNVTFSRKRQNWSLPSVEGTFVLVYLPTGGEVRVNTTALKTSEVQARWFDPRTGTTQDAGRFSHQPGLTLKAPSEGRGQDWLLIIDTEHTDLPQPNAG